MSQYIILKRPRPHSPFEEGLPEAAPGIGATAETIPGAGPARPAEMPQILSADISHTEARSLAADPSVQDVIPAMPIRLIEPMEAAADADSTWGVAEVGGLSTNMDGSGSRVAVLDTGIDDQHPAFAGVTLTQKDFSGSGNHDANGHGTHCAGTIFGRNVDGKRIGVAPGVTQAFIGKVLGDDGRGSSEMLFKALRWVADNDVDVVSMSLGFDFPGLAERLVEENNFPVLLATSVALEAYRKNLRVFDSLMQMFRAQQPFDGGTVVVAAAGNESRREQHPDFEVSASVPAAAEGVVSVGAAGQGADGLVIANFSNTNPTLSGPGVNVLSARTGGGLTALNGTSMACPHVAGVAALWWQAMRQTPVPVNADVIRSRLIASARATGFAASVDVPDRGQGMVQAPSPALF